MHVGANIAFQQATSQSSTVGAGIATSAVAFSAASSVGRQCSQTSDGTSSAPAWCVPRHLCWQTARCVPRGFNRHLHRISCVQSSLYIRNTLCLKRLGNRNDLHLHLLGACLDTFSVAPGWRLSKACAPCGWHLYTHQNPLVSC